MTSPISRPPIAAGDAADPRSGFTLIELILVMALLVIAFGLTLPALQSFFRGRVLDSESRRLLALTRYGQNRAISEGVPMILWIDERERQYGLETAPSFIDEDPKALEFQLEDTLELEVAQPPLSRMGQRLSLDISNPGERTSPITRGGPPSLSGLPRIRFQPDGFIAESSPEYLTLREGTRAAVWLVQTTNRLAYELRTDLPERQRF